MQSNQIEGRTTDAEDRRTERALIARSWSSTQPI
jgi:hypothetical protein